MKRPSATDDAGAAATASLGGCVAALSRAKLLCLASAVAPVAQAAAPSTEVGRVVWQADEALRVGTRSGATITDKGTLR